MKSLSIFLLLLLLMACRDHRPPAFSAEQNAQLNEAEDMLNAAATEQDSKNEVNNR